MARQVIELKYQIGDRTVTVRAMDAVSPEDCFQNLMESVLHRYITGEDLTAPVQREVKDFLIKQNLTI